VFFVPCCLFFGFVFFHHGFEFIEPAAPQGAERFNKVGHCPHFFHVDLIVNFPAVLSLGENLNVLRNGLAGGFEIAGDGPRRERLRREQAENRPPGGVGNGLKHISSGFHHAVI
jgi:hypothetical protein